MKNIYLALRESIRDLMQIKYPVEDKSKHLEAGLSWMKRAQDYPNDGGVSAWYSMIDGWRPSYVETTGYIIETFIKAAKVLDSSEYLLRAEKMGNFLIAQQLPSGGYRSHTKRQKKESRPTVFDTGQDILGMCDLYEETKKKKYLSSAVKAADFLIRIQEKEGVWRKNTFGNRVHIYHTRVAWPILRVALLTNSKVKRQAALKFFDWALKQQLDNGWFKYCELVEKNQQQPYTHTIAYTIEGFLYAGLLMKDRALIMAAIKGSLVPLNKFLQTNKLEATYDNNWSSNDKYMCLTGNAQFAVIWGELFKLTKYPAFKTALHRMNILLSSTQARNVDPGINGAIKGSLPLYGDLTTNTGYCRFAYLNWATKYYLDSVLLEMELDNN